MMVLGIVLNKEQYAIMRQVEDRLWWYVGMRRIVDRMLSAAMPTIGNLRVLDAGCGTGANLEAFRKYGRVVGVDVADEALCHCRERGHEAVVQGSIEQLPFASESFDLVSCFDVIYHLAVHEDTSALREFYRVLRPSGRLILRAPAYDWLRGAHDAAVHTRHRYTGHELRDKLRAAGFRVWRISHANSLLLPIAVLKRLAESRGVSFSSDLSQPASLSNNLLKALLYLEARMIRRVDLPVGLSVVALGIKECAGNVNLSGVCSS